MTKNLIRYNQPNISSSDILAVSKVLRSTQLTHGKVSNSFQNRYLMKFPNILKHVIDKLKVPDSNACIASMI